MKVAFAICKERVAPNEFFMITKNLHDSFIRNVYPKIFSIEAMDLPLDTRKSVKDCVTLAGARRVIFRYLSSETYPYEAAG